MIKRLIRLAFRVQCGRAGIVPALFCWILNRSASKSTIYFFKNNNDNMYCWGSEVGGGRRTWWWTNEPELNGEKNERRRQKKTGGDWGKWSDNYTVHFGVGAELIALKLAIITRLKNHLSNVSRWWVLSRRCELSLSISFHCALFCCWCCCYFPLSSAVMFTFLDIKVERDRTRQANRHLHIRNYVVVFCMGAQGPGWNRRWPQRRPWSSRQKRRRRRRLPRQWRRLPRQWRRLPRPGPGQRKRFFSTLSWLVAPERPRHCYRVGNALLSVCTCRIFRAISFFFIINLYFFQVGEKKGESSSFSSFFFLYKYVSVFLFLSLQCLPLTSLLPPPPLHPLPSPLLWLLSGQSI